MIMKQWTKSPSRKISVHYFKKSPNEKENIKVFATYSARQTSWPFIFQWFSKFSPFIQVCGLEVFEIKPNIKTQISFFNEVYSRISRVSDICETTSVKKFLYCFGLIQESKLEKVEKNAVIVNMESRSHCLSRNRFHSQVRWASKP